LTIALGLAATPARAETTPTQPVSKEAAQYQAGPRGMFSCSVCTLFVKPRSCKIVSGDISPYGWCKYFDLPD
jgi:hypothetical protein